MWNSHILNPMSPFISLRKCFGFPIKDDDIVALFYKFPSDIISITNRNLCSTWATRKHMGPFVEKAGRRGLGNNASCKIIDVHNITLYDLIDVTIAVDCCSCHNICY